MNISIGTEKAFDEILNPFMIKIPSKLDLRENILNLIKGIYKSPTGYVTLRGEILNTFPLKMELRERCPLSSLLCNIVVEILVTTIRWEGTEEQEGEGQENYL